MSRSSNFIDGNDNFRELNLRFVRNEFEDNLNQFFGGADGAGPEATGNTPPPRDSIIVKPTPGNGNDEQLAFRSVQLHQRTAFLRQLGLKRSQAHCLAVASLKVPDFNLRNIQRQRFRMSVEAGDSRQSEVDEQILFDINEMIESRQQWLKNRPRTPPPPCNIDWQESRDPSFRHISRQHEASPEHFELARRYAEPERNEHFRERNKNFERDRDHFHGRQQNFERNHNIRRLHQDNEQTHFERYDTFRASETFNDNNKRTSRKSNMEDLNINPHYEQIRDDNRRVCSSNRDPNNVYSSVNNRQGSREEHRTNLTYNDQFREGPRPRSFERNMDFDEDFRAVPRHVRGNSSKRRHVDSRLHEGRCHERNHNNQDYNCGKQQSDFRPRARDLNELQDVAGFGRSNNRNNSISNRSHYNPDYNALLDTDERLLDEPDPNFWERTNRNCKNVQSNDSSQMNWNNMNNAGNYSNWNNYDNTRNQSIWNNNNHPSNTDYPDNMKFSNRNPQQPEIQSRNNSFNYRSTQAQVATRLGQQQPPKATKKPLITSLHGNSQMPNQANKSNTNNGSNPNRPNKPQASKQNQQQSTNPTNSTGNRNVGNNQGKANNCSVPNSNKPTIKQSPQQVAAKSGQKRTGDAINSDEIKTRKTAIQRDFLIGGHKLPYINQSGKGLPQPEDKSYAVTFFEQQPIYNTSIYATNNDEGDMANIDESEDENTDEDDAEMDGNTKEKEARPGTRRHSAIRIRIDKAWTKHYRVNNFKCWLTWWQAYKWCEIKMNKELANFGCLNIKQAFLPNYPKLSTIEVINVVMKSAHFTLEENTCSHYRNAKSLFVLMNDTFLENLPRSNLEQLQDMIRGIPNHLWVYKMRGLVYLWAEYHKIVTNQPRDEPVYAAIQSRWKRPLFHWMCKQAFDELKAISAIDWEDHVKQFPQLEAA